MDEAILLLGFLVLLKVIVDDMNNTDVNGVPNLVNTTADANVPLLPEDSGVVGPGLSNSGKLMQFASAIFNFEGGKPSDRNVRNNNPGNLKFAGQAGATPGPGGFAVFQTMDDGWNALIRQLQRDISRYPNLNLQQFFAQYLGQSDYLNPKTTDQGNPVAYAANVAGKLGVSPTDSLSSIFGGVV